MLQSVHHLYDANAVMMSQISVWIVIPVSLVNQNSIDLSCFVPVLNPNNESEQLGSLRVTVKCLAALRAVQQEMRVTDSSLEAWAPEFLAFWLNVLTSEQIQIAHLKFINFIIYLFSLWSYANCSVPGIIDISVLLQCSLLSCLCFKLFHLYS